MKRFIPILFLTLCLTFLCGCEKDTAEDAVTVTTAASEEESKTTAEAPYTLEQMNQIYEEATEVWNWFDLDPLSVAEEYNDDGSMKFYTVDGIDGYQIVNDDINGTMASLKAGANAYFSPEIVADLFADDRYVEEDGILYEMAADRGTDITVDKITERKITDYSNTSVTYVITAEIIDPETEAVIGTKDYTYTYATTGGHWVFTAYQPIY